MTVVSPVPGKPLLLLGALDIGGVGYVAEEFSGLGDDVPCRNLAASRTT